MGDYRPDVYEAPGELDQDYDWDYGDEDAGPPPPKILWGRVVVLGGLVVLALLLGLWAAPNGFPEEEAEKLRTDLSAARGQITVLQDQVDQQRAAIARQERTIKKLTDAASTTDPGPGDTETTNVKEYTVERGDSLTKIAMDFYDDENKADCLADYNDIDRPNQLLIGATILIPPEDEVCE